MNKKIVKSFTYTGLGFPIELRNVEMIMIQDEWHPKIDVRKVADQAMEMLVSQKTRLTGDQIRFIRTYYSMSLREFAAIVNESHMAVKKWEDFKAHPTTMDLNIEKNLRLYMYDQIVIKVARNKAILQKLFYEKYLFLRKMFAAQNRKGGTNKSSSVAA